MENCLISTISEAITSLRSTKKTSRMGALLPTIEHALAQGVAHKHILSQLNSTGFQLSNAHYHNILQRLRSEARASQPTDLGVPSSTTTDGRRSDEVGPVVIIKHDPIAPQCGGERTLGWRPTGPSDWKN